VKTITDFMPQIRKALSYGSRYTAEELCAEIVAGRAQLWHQGDGMVVTQLDHKPSGRGLYFWVAAGDLDDVIDLHRQACEWGKSVGCTWATFVGRKGWEKVLVDEGWKADKRIVFYEKDLTHG